MADSAVAVTAGSGTNIDTRTEASNGNHRAVVVLGDPSVNSGVAPVDGVLGLSTYFSTRPTVSVVGNIPAAGGSLTAYQGGGAWLTTLATLPVVTNVTGYALESGGNLDSIITTLNNIKTKTDNLDVTLGSRLASGGTLPITGTINALNAGGSLTAFQGGGAWLTTLATLPVVTNVTGYALEAGNLATIVTTLNSIKAKTDNLDVTLGSRLGSGATLPITGTINALNAGGSLSAFQGGTWTVQPGNTPNTTAWLVTMATIPVVATVTAGTNAIGKLLPPDIDVTAHTNYAKKYYTSTGAVTDGIVWSPAAGKRWHVVSMIINVSAAATVTLEDDKSGGDEVIMKMELAANSGVAYNFSEKYPFASGEDAADLLVTTTAGNIYITITGYEI